MAFVYFGAIGLIGIVKCAYDYIYSDVPKEKYQICEEIKQFDINTLKKVNNKPTSLILTSPYSWHDEISKKIARKFANALE
jgi:hypothetical protein